MKSLVIMAVVAALAGCGGASGLAGGEKDKAAVDDGDPLGKNPEGETGARQSLYVLDDASLPTCNADAEGWLVYVKSTAGFKACLSGSWTDVEVGDRIVASIGCSGNLAGTSLWASYSAAQMSSGDVFASGSISDAYIQASQTNYYSAQQSGALTAPVMIVNDQLGSATSGFFRIELDRKTLVTRVDYFDDEASDTVWTMRPSACVVNEY